MVNPRWDETAYRKLILDEFFRRNYQYYYGILIFTPIDLNCGTEEDALMEEANRMWLMKNNII